MVFLIVTLMAAIEINKVVVCNKIIKLAIKDESTKELQIHSIQTMGTDCHITYL
ncbi:unnamed protein product [Rhizopus stolonifer]